jgi:foldase protein PrsA
MRSKRFLLLLLAGACVAGIDCGQLIDRSPHFRNAIGILFGRGHLLAFTQGEGIYEADLRRALSEVRYATGVDEKARGTKNTGERPVLMHVISNAAVRSLAAREKISRRQIDSGLNFLHWQVGDEKAWRSALRTNRLSVRSLRRRIALDIRAREWIDRQIISQIDPTEDECRNFYDGHPESFMQPVRFRAGHLFLAAPPQTPPGVVDTKQNAIESTANRIKHGENLAELCAAASEDKATKNRVGDLGFFSEFRIPPDFLAAISKMGAGKISQPFRTRLGFHIVQLTDSKPARQMTFEEARSEIRLVIENEKRGAALQRLTADLLRQAKFVANRF